MHASTLEQKDAFSEFAVVLAFALDRPRCLQGARVLESVPAPTPKDSDSVAHGECRAGRMRWGSTETSRGFPHAGSRTTLDAIREKLAIAVSTYAIKVDRNSRPSDTRLERASRAGCMCWGSKGMCHGFPYADSLIRVDAISEMPAIAVT